jgi:hypothetical protein
VVGSDQKNGLGVTNVNLTDDPGRESQLLAGVEVVNETLHFK